MRKELTGILFFFLMLFAAASLLSYSPLDPSVHHAVRSGKIHNVFGLVGAQVAGLLIGFFGLGSFWIPVLLLLCGFHVFRGRPAGRWIATLAGGLPLVVFTGSLFSLAHNSYQLLGRKWSSGGVVGIPLKSALVDYLNPTGALIVLLTLWTAALVVATNLSVLALLKRTLRVMGVGSQWMGTRWTIWRQRREKARRRPRPPCPEQEGDAPSIRIKRPPAKRVETLPEQQVFAFMHDENGYRHPSISLLEDAPKRPAGVDTETLAMKSRLLEKKLEDFGVKGKVVEVCPGPVITTFEYEPAAGVKINKIANLSDDLAMVLRAISVRIVAPIPGKAAVGIEIPNEERELVRFKEVVASGAFVQSKSKLTLCLGKDIVGNPTVADLAKMPHLLIAGATGSGKSVALNAMICSLLYKANPDEVKLVMVDPKRIELSSYDGIPHLITPVVMEVKKATNALMWAVQEMEQRYQSMAAAGARNLKHYNQKVGRGPEEDGKNPLPYIVIVIDELADLMLVATRDVEVCLTRLAQMARAAGIHLILATQRPSVDVLTGVIKANFPTRISFQVSSRTDSRTVIDMNGAESLLGNGDMLFLPPGTSKVQRIHGAFISEEELGKVLEFIKQQRQPSYDSSVTEAKGAEEEREEQAQYDEKYDEAVALVTETRQASISMIQRRLRIGYNRAARIIETMEKEGIVGSSDGVRPREVLVRSYDDTP